MDTTSSINSILKSINTGQRLLVETEQETLVGNFNKIDVNRNFLILDAVRDMKNNLNFKARQVIPIKTITCLKPEGNEINTSIATTITNNPHSDSTNLSPFELQLLQKQINSIVILREKGAEYKAAITDIKTQQSVGIFVEPSELGRHHKTSIIAIATVKQIYVFDILTFGKLFSEFKNLLESCKLIKAMHCSHLVADHFQHQHNLYVKGIFDTFLAYNIVVQEMKELSLESAIKQFFGIKSNIFIKRDRNYPYNTYERPLNENFVKECAKKAFFTLKLQEHLKESLLSKVSTQSTDSGYTLES